MSIVTNIDSKKSRSRSKTSSPNGTAQPSSPRSISLNFENVEEAINLLDEVAEGMIQKKPEQLTMQGTLTDSMRSITNQIMFAMSNLDAAISERNYPHKAQENLHLAMKANALAMKMILDLEIYDPWSIDILGKSVKGSISMSNADTMLYPDCDETIIDALVEMSKASSWLEKAEKEACKRS